MLNQCHVTDSAQSYHLFALLLLLAVIGLVGGDNAAHDDEVDQLPQPVIARKPTGEARQVFHTVQAGHAENDGLLLVLWADELLFNLSYFIGVHFILLYFIGFILLALLLDIPGYTNIPVQRSLKLGEDICLWLGAKTPRNAEYSTARSPERSLEQESAISPSPARLVIHPSMHCTFTSCYMFPIPQ